MTRTLPVTLALFSLSCFVSAQNLPSIRYDSLPLSEVETMMLPTIDAESLAADSRSAAVPGPLRVAKPIDMNVTLQETGTWEWLPNGKILWRMRFVSPGATDLNFGFGYFALPEDAELYLYSDEHEKYVLGPFTGKQAQANGDSLWTPMVPGQSAVLELVVSAETQSRVHLELTRVSQGFMDFLGFKPDHWRQGACNIDVVCPEGDPWRDQIRAVGAYTVNGIDTCSGTLVMDAAASFRNYFLTAAHCGVDAGDAPAMVVYWNFESENCGDLSGGVRDQFSSGATYRASRADVDMSLVELNSTPDPSFNVFYAGWDRSNTVPNGSVGIHHPGVDEKAISFNDDPLTTVTSCIGGGTPDTHWEVDNWELGTTEGGSSGSALFDPANGLIVGFLSGGLAACGNQEFDCYGKLAVAWDGPSPDRRLSDWLDPNDTGVMTVQGSNPAASLSLGTVTSVDSCGGPGTDNGVWEPGETIELTITITGNEAITGITGTLTSSTPGVTVESGALTFPDVPDSGVQVTADQVAVITLAPDITCYTDVSLTLETDSDATDPQQYPISEQIGLLPTIDLPIAIPDDDQITIPIMIGEDVTMTDLDVLVQIDHTWVGDLQIFLESPAGTTVTLLDRPGAPATTNGCDNENMDVLFDDDATFQLEDHCEDTDPWYQGDADPVDPLAAFNGESTLGTWMLTIVDNAGQDTGNLVGFELQPSPGFVGICQVCEDQCSGLEVTLASEMVVCPDTSFQLQPVVGGGTEPYGYSWTPGASLDNASILDPNGMIGETTMYTLTVTDDEGCETMASITVHVLPVIAAHAEDWRNHENASPATDLNGDAELDVLDLIENVNEDCVEEM